MNASDECHNTPLHIACKRNNVAAVELLVRHRADLSSWTYDHQTPLHCAAQVIDTDEYNEYNEYNYNISPNLRIYVPIYEHNTCVLITDYLSTFGDWLVDKKVALIITSSIIVPINTPLYQYTLLPTHPIHTLYETRNHNTLSHHPL